MSNYSPRRKVVIGRYWNRPKAKTYDCNARDAERFFQSNMKEYEQSKREARAYTDMRDTNIARRAAVLEEECPIKAPSGGRRARSAIRDREAIVDRRKDTYVNTLDDLNPTLLSPNLYMASKKAEALRNAVEETKVKNFEYENDPSYYKTEKATNYTMKMEPTTMSTPIYDNGLDSRLSETRQFTSRSSELGTTRSSLGPRDREPLDDNPVNVDQLSSNYRDRLAKLRDELGLPELGSSSALETTGASGAGAGSASASSTFSSTAKSSSIMNDIDRSSPIRSNLEGPKKRAPYSPYNVTDRTLRAHGLAGPSANELPDMVDNAELPDLKMNFPSSKEILERIKAIEDDL